MRSEMPVLVVIDWIVGLVSDAFNIQYANLALITSSHELKSLSPQCQYVVYLGHPANLSGLAPEKEPAKVGGVSAIISRTCCGGPCR